MNYHGKKILILGMGNTGLSTAKWLSRTGAILSAADTRQAPPNQALFNEIIPAENVHCGPFQASIFSQIDLIAISPGIPLGEPLVAAAVQQGIPVVGDIELFALALREHGHAQTKIIAITGSNGKSTVTTMVGMMAESAGWEVEVAGNIGRTVLDALMQSIDNNRWPQLWVLELSSFQLETTRNLQADAAAVLNLSEDHLDRYDDMSAYAAAKSVLFSSSNCRGIQVLNRDDPLVLVMARVNCKQFSFGLTEPATDEEFGVLPDGADLWLAQGNTCLMKTSELAVAGLHNAANALAALALCRAISLPFEPLLSALRDFKGLPHRMQKVADFNEIAFFNDSKSTNVGSAIAALNGLPAKVILIAGGDGKGQNFLPLKHPVRKHARSVVLLGRDAASIASVIQDCGIPVYQVATMQKAVQLSFLLAEPGDYVLLSPACASLDMFNNYVHRAEVFVSAVKAIENNLVLPAQVQH
ncbi:MAG: UDP-N-acetylmuramoyl-L-alanine--D-glutamate ligase [Nitrosomonas sp.]|nr:UDP-N-acetylmuramoyl-L-alanine--D-glutamate ligase [Nitrosomonas sp.]